MQLVDLTQKSVAAFLLALALLFGAAETTVGQSQGGTGQIVGTVYDSSGALVAGAKITLHNKATGLTREETSNDQGQYSFILLPVGPYNLTFGHPGFQTSKVDVEVTVGAALTINATLAPGEVSQVVEVKATPLIESTQDTATALVGVRAIQELPINGRRFQDFVTLTPTVQIEPQRSGVSFAGQRGINSNVTIDGTDYNEPFFGGLRGGERANNAYTIPQEAISQFQVVTSGYSVEFGRSTGGLLNATTKSGTNRLHGSAFFFARNGELAANDAFNRTAITNLYQSGGSLGGPVKRDRLFFFAAVEDQKNDNPHIVDFPRIDTFGAPTPAQTEAFNFYKSQEVPYTQTNDAITGFGRMDFQPNPNHRVAVSYHYSKNTGENATSTGDSIQVATNRALSNNGTEGDRTNTVVGQWTAIFSPRLIMETRGQYSLENRPRTANSHQAGNNTSIGITGTRDFLPTTLDDYRVQYANNLTWTSGTHSLKFGGEFDFLHVNQLFKFNQFGVFSFFSSTGSILSVMGKNPNRFDNSAVQYRVNIGNGLLDLNGRQFALFIEDTWRVTPRLTLTGGFRWEGYVNPQPDVSNTALYNQVKNFPFPIGVTVDPAHFPNNYRQYMPRIGLAWDPRGDAKTVIRADAGFFYAATPLLLYAAPLNNFRIPAGDLTVSLPFTPPKGAPCSSSPTVYCEFNLIGIDLNTFSLDKLPTLTADQIAGIASALGIANPNPFVGAAPISVGNNFESPRSLQAGVGFEREITRGWSVGADFLYINTTHLERDRNLNLPPPLVCSGSPLPAGCTSADLSLRPCFGVRGGVCKQGRPVPTLGDVTIRESSARSRYDGLTIRSNYQRGRAQFQAYYTLSYNYADDDNERLAFGFDSDNAYNLKPEYGFSRLDARHQFQFNGLVDLPFGFTVSGLGRFRSGRPIDPLVGTSDVNGDGNSFGDRAFQAPGVSFRRNSFRDRRVSDVDLRVAKKFNLPREGMRLDVTADFFNLFKFPNVTYQASTSSPFNPTNDFGVGVDKTGAVVPPLPQFRQLKALSFCSLNSGCYNTNNTPGSPFTVQLGIRFLF